MARHCSTLFADDTHFVARMKGLRQYNPGQLGDRVCFHCGALLFVAESRVVPRPAWQVRHAAYVNANAAWAVDRDDWRAKLASHVIPRRYEGISCCRGGRVVLPPMRTSPVVEELFRGATPRSRVFRQYTRKINNAMAFASEKGSMKVARGTYPSNTTRAPQPGGAADPSQPHMHNGRGVRPTLPRGHAPDYMVCGKLYHFVGPLLPAPGVPSAFAQLYVHDPTALDDVVSERFNHIPLSRDDAKNPRVHGHLLAIVRALHEEMFRVNPYASDFKMAADIFREQEVTNAVFVIDADKAPVDAPLQYSSHGCARSRYRDPLSQRSCCRVDFHCAPYAPRALCHRKPAVQGGVGVHRRPATGSDPTRAARAIGDPTATCAQHHVPVPIDK